MKLNLTHIIYKSIIFNRIRLLYQFLIIMFLSAVITGSLLTGNSVRTSLAKKNESRLNSTSIVVSSGTRQIPHSFAGRLQNISGERCEGLLELEGWVRSFNTGESALNIQVFGTQNSFFSFDGNDTGITLVKGEAAINSNLAEKLDLKKGDDIILRVGASSDIPADSPFAPEDDPFESFVLTVKEILTNGNEEDFSLGINQVKPMNLYLPLANLNSEQDKVLKINRIIIKESESLDIDKINDYISQIYTAEDAGLKIREIENGRGTEIVSDRIFISKNEIDEVTGILNEAKPVITYLANRFSLGEVSTPYSFVTGMPSELYNDAPEGDEIVLNRWLADDLGAIPGDTIRIDYYVMGDFKNLVEQSNLFIVKGVVETESVLLDRNLMPEFPGISGSESCSRWDAGVPITLDDIRDKDEDYWNDYGGTPKAIINYKRGEELWGSEFGPATAIRFPAGIRSDYIESSLKGKINPFSTGLVTIPIQENSIAAAKNSVDFSTLFLSLGFFIIVSSIILLVLVISTGFETRYSEVITLRALGFSNRLILRIFSIESMIIAVTGSLAGIFLGSILDNLIIGTLNSVWQGAVQTDTLSSYTDFTSLFVGFVSTLVIIALTVHIQLRRELKKVDLKDIIVKEGFTSRNIKSIFIISSLILLTLLSFTIFGDSSSTTLWFGSGTILFITLLLGVRYILKLISNFVTKRPQSHINLSWLYFSNYPSRAVTPILFLAAGLFIVIITGANRKSFNRSDVTRESGTGGFLYWAETATPLLYDLNSERGKFEYNLDSEEMAELHFIQAKKSSGDDASCLNLNQVKSPPLIGIDASYFSETGSFSFASTLENIETENTWDALSLDAGEDVVYGIADQTVLQWSLLKKPGDTIFVSSETGETLKIIIAGGLESSIFQGHIIIGLDKFKRYYPSKSGSSIFLVDGSSEDIETTETILSDRLSQYGIDIEKTYDRLSDFNEVTNTYLTVFLTLGGIGLIMGVLGLGFVMLRNFNIRKREYALILASGSSPHRIRVAILKEYFIILITGVILGVLPAPIATLPSILSDATIPFGLILAIVGLIVLTGTLTITLSVRRLINSSLIDTLRKE